jgi:hypothetical protein
MAGAGANGRDRTAKQEVIVTGGPGLLLKQLTGLGMWFSSRCLLSMCKALGLASPAQKKNPVRGPHSIDSVSSHLASPLKGPTISCHQHTGDQAPNT